MKGGMIIVDGTAGLEVGMRMRRGTIVIGGPARDFTGLQMKGGTIVLLSGAEIRTGAWMNRGTIISMKPLELMPTFTYSTEAIPIFLMLLARHLRRFGIQVPHAASEGTYRSYAGDTSVSDKGEVLIWRPCT
jgi:formylmethanofuran dehydrogenase subunit C